jgi:hypothetical protein
VPARRESDAIVHEVDAFTTLALLAGAEVPADTRNRHRLAHNLEVAGSNPSLRVIAEQRNSPDLRLGVKWSPVHLRSQPTMSVLAITAGLVRVPFVLGLTASQATSRTPFDADWQPRRA